jgi:hypothetical protein
MPPLAVTAGAREMLAAPIQTTAATLRAANATGELNILHANKVGESNSVQKVAPQATARRNIAAADPECQAIEYTGFQPVHKFISNQMATVVLIDNLLCAQ